MLLDIWVYLTSGKQLAGRCSYDELRLTMTGTEGALVLPSSSAVPGVPTRIVPVTAIAYIEPLDEEAFKKERMKHVALRSWSESMGKGGDNYGG